MSSKMVTFMDLTTMRPLCLGRIQALFLKMVGTSRCDVPARKAGGTNHANHANHASRCAAERGADGAARHPYQNSARMPPVPHHQFY